MSRSCIRRMNGGSASAIDSCWSRPAARIKEIDPAVMEAIEQHWDALIEAWNEKYPENPVSSAEEEEEGNENDA